MCYSVASKFAVSEVFQIERDFVVKWMEEEPDEYYTVSGFVHPKLPVITSEKHFKKMSWGLIPSWIKDFESGKKLRINTLNAQSETIDSKPSFRGAVKAARHCIVPVNGYFEWHHHASGEKYPHFIYPKHDKFFFFAGLFEQWKNPLSNEVMDTFTVLTTTANERMAQIHNAKKRMPVILSLNDAQMWLDAGIPFAEKQKLFQPYEQELMLDHTIGKLITSRKQNPNQPAVVEKVLYPELEL